jgi:Xaa-Pro aminopeptidase
MKLKQFQEELTKKELEASIFLCSSPIHDSNIQYFTGFQQTRFYSFSCLVITPDKSSLVTSKISYDRAKRQARADEIVNLKEYDNSLTKFLKEKMEKINNIGIIERIFPYKLAKKLEGKEFHDISSVTRKLRSVKVQKEIELIKKSCQIANQGIKIIQENLSTGISERDLVSLLEKELIRKGADEISFPTILASGKNSAYVHPEPSFSQENIKPGIGLVDFGARYKGYCSDITVPFAIGELSEKQKKIIRTVQDAYQKSIESLKIGEPTWKVFETAEKIITKNGFEFKHSLGHGLGLDVHDSPNLSPKPEEEEDLKDWKEVSIEGDMVFTIEPGVYEPEIGGCRLENDVLMTKNGPEILTKSKLIEL